MERSGPNQIKIFLWNQCNNRCLMCTNPVDLRNGANEREYSLEAKMEEILSKVSDGDKIQFTGGETTMHPDFFELLFWTRRNFPSSKILLLSNGRIFSYKEFTKKLLSIDNLTLQIPFLGSNDEIHDGITNAPNSFDETREGILNILDHKNETHHLEIRIVLTKKNISFLGDIMDFVKNDFGGGDSLVILFPLVLGSCRANFDNIGLKYGRAMKTIQSAVANRIGEFNDLRLYHFPLCQIDRSLWPHAYRSLVDKVIHFSSKCEECRYKRHCLGIPKHYFEIMGDGEFKPILEDMDVKEDDSNFSFHPITK